MKLKLAIIASIGALAAPAPAAELIYGSWTPAQEYQNRVVMRETLEEGLAEMFGGEVASRESRAARPSDVAADTSVADNSATRDSGLPALLREAKQHYDAAIQAQRDLDWARYGEEMRVLGEILNRMNSGPSR